MNVTIEIGLPVDQWREILRLLEASIGELTCLCKAANMLMPITTALIGQQSAAVYSIHDQLRNEGVTI